MKIEDMPIRLPGGEPLIENSWKAMLPLLVLAWKDAETQETRTRAWGELQRMAELADRYVEQELSRIAAEVSK